MADAECLHWQANEEPIGRTVGEADAFAEQRVRPAPPALAWHAKPTVGSAIMGMCRRSSVCKASWNSNVPLMSADCGAYL